jgi:hypothetical protein
MPISARCRSRPRFDGGADIVITGRCADSALALGILMHEFGWAADDYDRLGAGSLVGHILECGPQATGGTFHRLGEGARTGTTSAIRSPNAASDGSFDVSKPDGTGGPHRSRRDRRADAVRDRRSRRLFSARRDRRLFRMCISRRSAPTGCGRAAPAAGRRLTSTRFPPPTRTAIAPSPPFRSSGRSAAQGGATGEALIARARDDVPRARPAGFHRDPCRGTRCRSLLWRKIGGTRQSREVLLRLVVEHKQPRSARNVCRGTRLDRPELRARHDGHLFRPAEAYARGAAVHFLPGQDARSAARECRSATLRP